MVIEQSQRLCICARSRITPEFRETPTGSLEDRWSTGYQFRRSAG